MPLLIEPLIEWMKGLSWLFIPLFYVAIFVVALALLFLIFWIFIPDYLQWPYVRLKAERAFVVDRGRNIDDPRSVDESGDAAGRRTEGVFYTTVVSLPGHKVNEDGEIVEGEECYRNFFDRLLRKFGFYWVGLTLALRIMRNKWFEIEEKQGVKSLVQKLSVEYGVTLRQTPMAFELKDAPDKGNFKFTFIGTITWSITNILKARVSGQDFHTLARARLCDALLAFVKEREIYRPPAEKGENTEEYIPRGEENGELMSKDRIRDLFLNYCRQSGGVFDEIKKKYGYTMEDVTFAVVIPDPKIEEFLEARAKASLTWKANAVAEEGQKAVQAIRREWTGPWGDLFIEKPELFAKYVADGIEKNGPPKIWGMPDITSLLRQSAPSNTLLNEDALKKAQMILQEIQKGKTNGEEVK